MSIESILASLNKQAMEHLCRDNNSECFRLLKKAEKIIESPEYLTDDNLKTMTWNNLGVYFKRIDQLDQSLDYLKKSLKISDPLVQSETHLNILAVLLQQRKPKLAASHGLQAIQLLKGSNEYFVLVTALKNTSDAYMALGKLDQAFKLLTIASKIAKKHLNESHEVAVEVEEKIKSLKKIEKKFYFEKIKIREGKEFLSGFRKPREKIKESKSLERSPNVKKKKVLDKELIGAKTGNLKRKMQFQQRTTAKDGQFEVLEGKIQSLQSQLDEFESRYKELETMAKMMSPSRTQKINDSKEVIERKLLMIQHKWSNQAKSNKSKSREPSKEKAKRALVELEDLKKQAENEDLFGYDTRSKMMSSELEKNTMYKTFGYSTHTLFLKPC
jgi:tetratricopeptide (TPR) repeat protein